MCYPTVVPTKQCQNKTALLTKCLIMGVLSFWIFDVFATPLFCSRLTACNPLILIPNQIKELFLQLKSFSTCEIYSNGHGDKPAFDQCNKQPYKII